mmetsp:Transcript_42058/g.65772  ORF Transcript_42058/g.65772 Transcript_42058/m.65772 type:complete len:198 (-) Transcript_42058:201-794(-)
MLRGMMICLLLGSAAAFTAPQPLGFTAPQALALTSRATTQAPGVGLRSSGLRSAGVRPLRMAEEEPPKESQINPWLSLNTRGGALVWTGVLIVLPFFAYGPLAALVGDELQAGRLLGGFYTLFALVAWTGSYVFRVGTKDMTYSKQLKAYEDAVIAKRFEELQEDEVEALMDDLTDYKSPGGDKPQAKGSGWRPDQY